MKKNIRNINLIQNMLLNMDETNIITEKNHCNLLFKLVACD